MVTSLPKLVRPMLAVPGALPTPEHDDEWAYELKWDGVRAVAYADGGDLRLMSRNDLDVSRSYPEVLGLGDVLQGRPCVLDGELITLDQHGRSNFGRLQDRMHVKDAATARRLSTSIPVVYMVFDVLHLDGRSLFDVPFSERRSLLEELELAAPSWQTPPSFVGGGQDVFAASGENGMEGVVCKRLASLYRPGKRSPDWQKVKNIRTQEVIIAGWRPGKGRRAGGIGALMLAVNGPEGLTYVGGVGTGFTDHSLAELGSDLARLARRTSPFPGPLPTADSRDAQWVSPKLVGEVVFSEWTGDGRLRHPSWRGLRPDKSPADVVIETPAPS